MKAILAHYYCYHLDYTVLRLTFIQETIVLELSYTCTGSRAPLHSVAHNPLGMTLMPVEMYQVL